MTSPQSTPLSKSGLEKIQSQIEILRRDLGATGAMVFDGSGRLLIEGGHHPDLDPATFLALLGNAMSAANAVVHLLRDEGAFDLHFHEGQSYEMYTSRISDDVFLTLTFERGAGTSRVGMVWLTLRRAILELRALTQDARVKPGSVEDREIKRAITQSLDEALNLLDGDMLSTSSGASPKPKDLPSAKPAPPPADAPGAAMPHLSPSELDAAQPTISFDEARRLGYIKFDDLDEEE